MAEEIKKKVLDRGIGYLQDLKPETRKELRQILESEIDELEEERRKGNITYEELRKWRVPPSELLSRTPGPEQEVTVEKRKHTLNGLLKKIVRRPN